MTTTSCPIILKCRAMIAAFFLLANVAYCQEYNSQAICGSDTAQVRYVSRSTGARINIPSFECRQVSKWGIRPEIGRSSYIYTPETAKWLGRQHGGSFALYVAYGNVNLGIRAMLTSVYTQTELMLDGKPLSEGATLNPFKVEYSAGYSLNLKYNFCLEPYIAITSNKFYVLHEDSIGKHYQIPQVNGFTAGMGLNKYFRLKEFQFLGLFVRYGHGFSDFRKVHSSLGVGYSEWSFGVAYKGFAKKHFMKPLQNTDGLKCFYPHP